MSYFRREFTSFQEFKREAFHHQGEDLGKDELELLMELEEDEVRLDPRLRRRSPVWD